MSNIRKLALATILGLGLQGAAATLPAVAAEYTVDEDHSFVQWRIQHLGFAWMYGRFNELSGTFHYDADRPGESRVEVEIATASVDSNHAERDRHLRSADFLNVEAYPTATFRSTAYEGDAEGGVLKGELTLHGVTRPIEIELTRIGEGEDPWGGYRVGFLGTTTLTRADFGMEYDLGPSAESLELELSIEGIRQ